MKYSVLINDETTGVLETSKPENELCGTTVTVMVADENGNQIEVTGVVTEVFECIGY